MVLWLLATLQGRVQEDDQKSRDWVVVGNRQLAWIEGKTILWKNQGLEVRGTNPRTAWIRIGPWLMNKGIQLKMARGMLGLPSLSNLVTWCHSWQLHHWAMEIPVPIMVGITCTVFCQLQEWGILQHSNAWLVLRIFKWGKKIKYFPNHHTSKLPFSYLGNQ